MDVLALISIPEFKKHIIPAKSPCLVASWIDFPHRKVGKQFTTMLEFKNNGKSIRNLFISRVKPMTMSVFE